MDVNVLPSINKGSLLYFTLLYLNTVLPLNVVNMMRMV